MKGKIFFIVSVIFIMIFSTSQLRAEYYQYKDNNGNIVFTDDLSKIPSDQRPQVKSHKTIKSDKSLSDNQADNSMPIVKGDDQEISNNDFEKQRTLLDREYATLIKERDQLLSEKNLINTPAKQELYNQKVNNLNQRINFFKQKIKEFNHKIAQ